MDYCKALFRFASQIDQLPSAEIRDPTQLAFIGPVVKVGRRILPVQMIVGVERQFHKWRRRLVEYLFRSAFDSDNFTAQCQQLTGIQEILGSFFHSAGHRPTLVWTSPVWMRLTNWEGRQRLNRRDINLQRTRQRIVTTGSNLFSISFPSSDDLLVDVSKLAYHYSGKPRYYLSVPRLRGLHDQCGRLVSSASDYAVVLGHPDEERELEKGSYSPNTDFYRVDRGREYLDLNTVTIAKLRRYRSSRRPAFSPSPPSWRQAMFVQGANPHLRTRHQILAEAQSPVMAKVQFIRITFDPTDLRIVVILGAEREFDRFVGEHDGLATLLAQQFLLER